MNVRESIQKFLANRSDDSPFLIPLWTPDLETQIMVRPGSEEELVEGGVWSNGGETWSNLRWPWKAGTAPEYRDKEITFSPAARVARVGSTWWNWVRKESLAVGFDIDATDAGHAAGTNQIDEFKLGQIVAKLSDLDYVTLVRSTGGKGIHGYVMFEEGYRPATQNHNEHTQVALKVIEKIKEDTGLDLIKDKIVDVKGVILWFWASTSPKDHPGFSVVTKASRQLRAEEVVGWEDIRSSSKIANEVGNYQSSELDDKHIAILSELEDMGFAYRWLEGRKLAQTHTFALKMLFDRRAESDNPIVGMFHTLSSGSDPTTPNCYIIPREDGSFKVRRFGNSIIEHDSWYIKDGDTWTYFNQLPDPMGTLCNYAKSDGISSANLSREKFQEALEALGVKDFPLPDVPSFHVDYESSSGIITATCKWPSESVVPKGWTRNAKKISNKIPIRGDQEIRDRTILEDIDELFRFSIQSNNVPYGWWHWTKSNGWILYDSSGQLNKVLKQHFGAKAVDEILAIMQNNPWTMVNEPFGEEELSERRWNRGAASFVCPPSDHPGPHPHFDRILEHIGSGLDEAIKTLPWTGEWGIENGADYLRYWIASSIKYPFEPVPYLFLFGSQGCGKSILFETLSMLFPNAVKDVSQSMTNSSGFNAEMKSAVFAYVDEKDLNERGAGNMVYSRIKEWTVARSLTIHEKGMTPYNQRNTMRFIQCSNSINSIRIDRDDTRIVAIGVPKLTNPIPKSIMENALRSEAPYILRTLLTTEIPPAIERMRVPHVNTVAKLEIGESSMSEVQKYATLVLTPCPGHTIKFSEFKEKYDQHCGTKNIPVQGVTAIGSELRKMEDLLVVGKKGKNGDMFLANVQFKGENNTPTKRLVLGEKGRLA